jgi:uncharacterized protein (DUF1697 family)
MKTYVALLRGIAPTNPNMHSAPLKMAFEKMGFKNVRTVISSGNVIFETASKNMSALEEKIEVALPKLLGFFSSTIVRNKEDIKALLKSNPFEENPAGKPTVTFFKQPPDKHKLPKGDSSFKVYGLVEGTFCYTVDLKVINTPEAMLTLEKLFGKGITTRTWRTVERIFKKM